MSKIFTAEDISTITDIQYRDVLALLRLGEFKTVESIGKNRQVISRAEFLKYADRKGIVYDLAKLEESV